VYQASQSLHPAASRASQYNGTSNLHELDILHSSNSQNQRTRSPTGAGTSQTRISELPGKIQKLPRSRRPSMVDSEQTQIPQDVSSVPPNKGERKCSRLVPSIYVVLGAFVIVIAVSMCIGIFAIGKQKSVICLMLCQYPIDDFVDMRASQFHLHRSLWSTLPRCQGTYSLSMALFLQK
jgi:hypothetical protein